MEKKKTKKADYGFWFCLLFMVTAVFVMTRVELVKEFSDFRTHSRWAVGEIADPTFDKFYFYPVWHFFVKLINWLLPVGRENACALATSCFMGVLTVILYQFVKKEMGEQWLWGKRTALVLSLLYVTALYMPWFNRQIYLGQSSPTIWHNPTNMAVKPLALLIFLCFIHAYRERKRISNIYLAGLSGLLLLSCFIKPSFLQGFLPAVVIFLLLELVPNKGKTFCFSMKVALAFVPSGLYFIIQYFSVFDSTVERSIGIQPFAVMALDSPNPLFSIFLGIAFPLFVLLMLGGKKVDSVKIFSQI